MSSASKLLSSGGEPIGSLTLFPPNLANTLTLPDGKVFMRGGVIAKSSDYPSVPSAFQKQLNPPIKVADIGSGGSWRTMALDQNGYPLIINQAWNPDGRYGFRIAGASSASNDVVHVTSLGALSYPGATVNKLVTQGQLCIFGVDYSRTDYASSALAQVQQLASGATGASSVNPASGVPSAGACYALAIQPSGRWVALGRGTTSACYGDSSAGNPVSMISAANWQCAAASSNMFVAIASGGTIAASSPAGDVWTARTMPSSANWADVCWGNGRFVAIASGSSSAATSSDGVTWAASTLPSSQAWTSVCWASGLGLFVAVASGTTSYATSPDGTSWTPRSLPVAAAWECVIYSPALGRLLCCASDGRAGVMISSDGINWSVKGMPRALKFDRIESGGGATLYAYTQQLGGWTVNCVIAKSTDGGSSWSYLGPRYNIQVGSAVETPVRCINGRLVMVSSRGASNSLTCWSSSDGGQTWTVAVYNTGLGYNANFGDIAFGAGQYVLTVRSYNGNDTSYYFVSTDLVNWVRKSVPTSGCWSSIVYSGSRFLALCESGNDMVYSSADGVNWVLGNGSAKGSAGAGTGIVFHDASRGISYAMNTYLAAAYQSLDHGLTWSNCGNKLLPGLVVAGGRYALTSQNNVLTFDDSMASVSYASYATGLTLSRNMAAAPSTAQAISDCNLPLLANGQAYFHDGAALYTLDTAMWIDNRGTATASSAGSPYVAGGIYYMRVN